MPLTRMLLLAAIGVLAGCAAVPRIDTTYTSVSQDSRVQYLVLHYTQGDFPHSLEIRG